MAVTMEDVARRANVSLATVSRVLSKPHMVNPVTREAVLRAVDELGYSLNPLARGLRTRLTHSFAVVVSHITDSHEAAILEQLEDVALQHRCSLQVYVTQSSPERAAYYVQFLSLQRRVDGIFWLAPASLLDGITLHTPVVLVNSASPRAPRANYDYETITYLAAKHMVAMGHDEIILLRQEGDPFFKARWSGYWRAISEKKIPHQEALYVGDWKSLPNPASLIVPDDHVAVEVYRYARANNLRIPRDISLVGCGDVHFARYLSPPLTTVKPPNAELAKLAFELLTNFETVKKEEEVIASVGGELIVRESVFHR